MLQLDGVSVTYGNGTRALAATSLTIAKGQFVVLLGRSGAGKSTLLRSLNGLVKPNAGAIQVEEIGPLTGASALRLHRRRTGMIFQQHQLIARLTALDNVLTGRLAYHSAWRTLFPLPRADRRLGLECLQRMGLFDKALIRVNELSGGQQQRVGIARALAQEPQLILADEPVASLDPETAETILMLLRDICVSDGITVIVSLHQLDLARRFADRVIGMRDGAVVADVAAPDLTDAVADSIYRIEPPKEAESRRQPHDHSAIAMKELL